MSAPAMPEVLVGWADDAVVRGYVLERDGFWIRPPGGSWHLTRPRTITSYCGLTLRPHYESRTIAVTYPWPDLSCFSCMDKRWAKGIR